MDNPAICSAGFCLLSIAATYADKPGGAVNLLFALVISDDAGVTRVDMTEKLLAPTR